MYGFIDGFEEYLSKDDPEITGEIERIETGLLNGSSDAKIVLENEISREEIEEVFDNTERYRTKLENEEVAVYEERNLGGLPGWVQHGRRYSEGQKEIEFDLKFEEGDIVPETVAGRYTVDTLVTILGQRSE